MKSSSDWDGTKPPKSIHQVWGRLTALLRDIRETLRRATDDFYGKQDRLAVLSTVNEALKLASESCKVLTPIGTISDLESLVEQTYQCTLSPRTLIKAKDVLKTFLERTQTIVQQATEGKCSFQNNVLDLLEMHCSNFMKLGVPDDIFFQNLRSKTLRIRDHLRDFDKIVHGVNSNHAAPARYFSHEDFSQTVAIKFDCEQFGILRAVPDLVQKFEHVCAMAQDWLRSDKVYLEEVGRQIQKTKERIKELSSESHSTKFEYERLFAVLKQKQRELDDYDESFEVVCKEISQLECKKTRLDLEIHAVAKTLRNCRDQIRDLRSVSVSRQISTEIDAVDGQAPESEEESVGEEEREIGRGLGHAHSSYRSRLCRDARAHNVKMDFLKRKRRQLEKRIESRKRCISDMKSSESDMSALNRKLRAIAKKKTKLLEEMSSVNNHLEGLEQMLTHRLNPAPFHQSSNGRPRASHRARPRSGSRSGGRARSNESASSRGSASRVRKQRARRKKKAGQRAQDFKKAFKLITNNIGLMWKELARTLPYSPSREINETNIEIRAIEYEHPGQLKEQAYQSLVQWYNHIGRRASVVVLSSSLREINENRLADSIEKDVFGKGESSHESCRSD